MEKQEAAKLIRKRYIKEYAKHTNKKAKIAFALELLKIADENSLDDYQYWCSGLLSWAKSELSVAVDFFKKSLEIDSEFAYPWSNLGNVYYDQKKYEEALENYEEARKRFDKKSDAYWISLCSNKKTEITTLIDSANKRKAKGDRISRVLNEIEKQEIENQSERNKQSFLNFVKEYPVDEGNLGCNFQVLRRWNSYTPIIADNYHISKGGGYFLRIKGKGIVIDPGFNFIDNFKGRKHIFQEIDAVFITHAHNDHTSDLESILTLLHKFNSRVKGDPHVFQENSIRDELAKNADGGKGIPYDAVKEKDVQTAFQTSPRRKQLDIYLTQSTYQKYMGMLNLDSKEDYKLHTIGPEWKGEINGIKICAIPAKHHDLISDRDSVGFLFSGDNFSIVYTGDTGWSDEIEAAYKKIANDKHLYQDKAHKLLVAHIGGFKSYEKKYNGSETYDSRVFYKNHLGRLGLVKVNEVLEPNVCFVSEFGEELKGQRVKLAKIYDEVFDDTTFIAADIGLEMDLERGKINAIVHVDLDAPNLKDALKKDFIVPKDVGVRPLRKDFSLNYFSREHVNEADLIECLSYIYEDSIRKTIINVHNGFEE